MARNVWQWTEDCYDNSYAGIPADGRANEAPSSDPKAKDGQGNCLRVDRGGSWMFPAWLLRAATRERNPADFRDDIMGFRVARTLPSRFAAFSMGCWKWRYSYLSAATGLARATRRT
jgi:formylglycine-generating enzyme required for sulfatase activity